MLTKSIALSLICLIGIQNVNCATKKSWKSAANFDDEIPIFTPFKSEAALKDHGEKANSEENLPKTTETSSSPSPSAETLTGKISSKIRLPANIIAANAIPEVQKDQIKDFGKFQLNEVVESSSQTPVQEPAATPQEPTEDSVIINQILSHLNIEEEKEPTNNVEPEDDLEISKVNNDQVNVTQYKVGPLMNLTIDKEENSVNVNLDQTTLKDIFKGRGRRNSLLERVVPLFILPFLIQAAVVPFMVTTIKLFLMKSLFAGKIAILLLVLGALKNHQNSMYMKSMQHSPYYMKDFPPPYPERRVEGNFEGYKVEGKPETLIH